MTGLQAQVNRLLDEDWERHGRYDLDYFSPDDLYWEVLRHREDVFSGCAERDLRAAAAFWLTQKGVNLS